MSSRLTKLAELLRSALMARRAATSRKEDDRNRDLDELQNALEQRGRKTDDEYDDIELLGRGASHSIEEWNEVLTKRRVVESSNVYAYHFVQEDATQGILYVTFLYWEKGMKPEDRKGPGTTYAYYNFPKRKFQQFEAATADSAGRAVWDYCRIRGTTFGHQHPYTPVEAEGDYVPRKATAKGFATRNLIPPGVNPRSRKAFPLHRRSTLEPRKSLPNRGTPNRGSPNRGKP